MRGQDYKTRDRLVRYRLAVHAEVKLAAQAAGVPADLASKLGYIEATRETDAAVLRESRAQDRARRPGGGK